MDPASAPPTLTRAPVVVDATILVDHLRGHAPATGALVTPANGGRAISSLATVRAEILLAARPDEIRATRRLLDRIEWIPITEDLVELAVDVAASSLTPGSGLIEPLDLLTVAAARRLSARILTGDPSRYRVLSGTRAAY
jgi:hypothetical protein